MNDMSPEERAKLRETASAFAHEVVERTKAGPGGHSPFVINLALWHIELERRVAELEAVSYDGDKASLVLLLANRNEECEQLRRRIRQLDVPNHLRHNEGYDDGDG